MPHSPSHASASAVRLRPDALLVGMWGFFAVLGLGVAVFLVARDLDVVSLSLVVVATVASLFYLLQLVLPGLFCAELDTVGVRGRWLWHRFLVPWDHVLRAAVHDVVGESVLRLQLTDGRQVGLLLPVGSDVAVLHDELASRLGAGRP